jgi:predicted  nucleic acid-binding Zn-ribbon protein
VAVFLDRLVRTASEQEPGDQIARRLDDARNRLLDEAQGLASDPDRQEQCHRLVASLFAAPTETNRVAARGVLESLTQGAVASLPQEDRELFIETISKLDAAAARACFSSPPTNVDLMAAFLEQLMVAAAKRQGNGRRQWEERSRRYGPLLAEAATELATDGVSAEVHGKLLRRLFIDPTEAVREDAAKLVPALVEKARIRLNKEPAAGRTHELDAVRTSLTSAFANTQFRLPAPSSTPEPTVAARPSEAGAGTSSPRSELASGVAEFLTEITPEVVGYTEAEDRYAACADQELVNGLRDLLPMVRGRLAQTVGNGTGAVAGKGNGKSVDEAAYKLLLQEAEKQSTKIDILEGQLKSALENVEQVQRSEQVANKGVQDWRAKHDESQAKVAELSSRIKGLESQVGGLETQLRNTGGAVQQLAQAEKQRDAAVQLAEQHRREAEGLRGSQSTAQKEINTLRSELEDVRRQLSQAQSDLQRQAERLRGAEEARDRFSRERDAANEETRRLRAASEAGFRELTASRGEVERLSGLLDAAGKKVTAMEGQLEELSQEMQHWSKVEVEIERVDALAKQLIVAQNDITSGYGKPEIRDNLALLLNYSLAHLVIAISRGDDARRAAMLMNLFKIADTVRAKVPTFGLAKTLLEKVEPASGTLPQRFNVHEVKLRKGSELFQHSLRTLRQHQLELAPFHYEVDEQGTVYLTG